MLAGLGARPHFEDAAALFLRSVMDAVLDAGREAPSSARVLRAMVHDRPLGGYRRLAVMDADETEVSTTRVGEAFLPSATAWRWIVEHRRPASIDVNLATIASLDPDGPAAATDPSITGTPTDESRLRLLRRGATHVYVLPLVAPRGAVSGLVSAKRSRGRTAPPSSSSSPPSEARISPSFR